MALRHEFGNHRHASSVSSSRHNKKTPPAPRSVRRGSVAAREVSRTSPVNTGPCADVRKMTPHLSRVARRSLRLAVSKRASGNRNSRCRTRRQTVEFGRELGDQNLNMRSQGIQLFFTTQSRQVTPNDSTSRSRGDFRIHSRCRNEVVLRLCQASHKIITHVICHVIKATFIRAN